MVKFLNKKLYENVKKMADDIYIKPSAYKSGFIVKKYKELGGKFQDDNEDKNLKRWFEEDWKDIADLDYPVFRPTKRINNKTPLTPDEIDYNNLNEQIALKQIIRGDKNLPKFKKKNNDELKLLNEIASHLKEHIKEGNYDDLDIKQLKEIQKFIKLKQGKGVINDYEKANKIPKTDSIWLYSNPIKAQKKAKDYLGKDVILYRSNKKDKKYMIEDDEGKWIHFGQMGYEDYLHHNDYERMLRYRARATNMKGNWKNNPYSPNNLSINILW
jgi:hypothetical protein